MRYLIQWASCENSVNSGSAKSDSRINADNLADAMAKMWGGISTVTRISDGIVVYRVWNLKESESNVAA